MSTRRDVDAALLASHIREAFSEVATAGWRAHDIGMGETQMLAVVIPATEPVVQSLLRKAGLA